MMQMFVNSFKR